MASDTSNGEARLRVDLHSHTNHSWDGVMSPATLVRRAKDVGLDRIAVTDHNEIDGALRARDLAPELVIVGEEVRCRCGSELIGLFIERRIPPGLPVEEVADRIREQGGIVYAPHPYAYLTRASERAGRVLAVADICEAFNSRAFLRGWNRKAGAAAQRLGIAPAASSDAHLPIEVGRAWTELPWLGDADALMSAVENSVMTVVRTSSFIPHLATLFVGAGRLALSRIADLPNGPLVASSGDPTRGI